MVEALDVIGLDTQLVGIVEIVIMQEPMMIRNVEANADNPLNNGGIITSWFSLLLFLSHYEQFFMMMLISGTMFLAHGCPPRGIYWLCSKKLVAILVEFLCSNES